MKIDNALASLAVKDLKAAAAWYEKLFRKAGGFDPDARGGGMEVRAKRLASCRLSVEG
jgi:hypothetical protein